MLLLHLLHAFQDTRFVRLIRPGDVLTATVRSEAARETRNGVLLTFGVETRGTAGAEVAQSWFEAFSGLRC
jgi:acyl dehydratase